MRIALALVIAVVPSIAQAGWQGTEWGMDRAAVRKLISFPLTDVRAPNPIHSSPDLIGTYKTADFTFSAHLSFNKDGRLVDVDLRLDPRQCHRLKDAMFAKYGSVESSLEDMEIFEWRDGSARNLVSMVSLDGEPAICAIGYSPLPEDQTEGL